jgi:hypothetical protein
MRRATAIPGDPSEEAPIPLGLVGADVFETGLGRDYGTEAEGVSAVKPNVRLVANAPEDLQDGAQVQIVKATS